VSKVEDALRRALADQPRSTDQAQILPRVEHALQRRHRIRRLAATAAATVTVLALAGGGLWAAHQRPAQAPHSMAAQSGVVPWIDTRGVPAISSQPTPSAHAAESWPSCEPTSLRASYGSTGVAAGTAVVYLDLTNAGSHGCVLAGAPTAVLLVRPDGRAVPVNGPPIDAASMQLRAPAALSPGQHAEFVVGASDMCPASVKPTAGRFAAIRFRVGSGPWMKLAAPEDGPIDLFCARWFTGFGVQPPAPNPVNANPLHVLDVTSTMPATVTAGQPVHYQIVLRNPTDHSVALTPCPTYTQFLALASPHRPLVEHRYRLNCAGAAGRITAHSKVVFAMQIPAPTTAGEAKFDWSIGNAGLVTGRALTITNQ
jgi:hypothetical protein